MSNPGQRAKLQMARERIADLEYYAGKLLESWGECPDAPDDAEVGLCTQPECSYCELARALQPTICGLPLVPRTPDSQRGEP